MSGRRLIANLLFESELARAYPSGAKLPGRRPRSTSSRAALETAAAYGTLLRAFAQEGDRLWLPAPLDPARMPEIPGLPRPMLETGPLAALESCQEILAWGESLAVATLRAREARRAGRAMEGNNLLGLLGLLGAVGDGSDRRGGSPTDQIENVEVEACSPSEGTPQAGIPGIRRAVEHEALADALWDLDPAPPSVVAQVHHRAFALDLTRSLDCALPGAAMLDSLLALEAHLRAGNAPFGRWVVKAPLSASGRDRYIERSAGTPTFAEPAVRRRLEILFATHGPLLFEPWMERTDDFGVCALVSRAGVRVLGCHRLEVDLRGQFAAIEIDHANPKAGLTPEEAAQLLAATEGVGAALDRAGYSGPFGLDAWRYRHQADGIRFHPLGEINARLTFGFVARALGERLATSGMFGAARRFRLEVGQPTPGALTLVAGPEPGTVLAAIRVL